MLVLAQTAASLDDPLSWVKVVFQAVQSGNWWVAASALLVLIVAALRAYGKKLHDWLPDNVIWDKPLWFIFDTKWGAWSLNLLTAVSGGVGTALLAGAPVSWALVKPIVMVAVTGSVLWELARDILGAITKNRAEAAGKAAADAVKTPGDAAAVLRGPGAP